MKIRKSSLIFKNVIRAEILSNEAQWRNDIRDFKNLVTKPGVYPIGPVFFKINESDKNIEEKKYIFYIPMRVPIDFEANDVCAFIGDVSIKECLAIKQVDLDEDMEEYYKLIKLCAKENDLQLDSEAYHVYLENYGVEIIDIYFPIKNKLFQ